jgi:predicted glycosyltransferase
MVRAPLLTVVAGPLCLPSTWQVLVAASRGNPSIRLRSTVADLSFEMARSQLSISQCGYNTALDIVAARVPALVVPFAEGGETEQADRARRLEALGVVRVVPAGESNGVSMAAAIEETLRFQPAAPALDLNGAERTARFLTTLADARSPAGDRYTVADERLA